MKIKIIKKQGRYIPKFKGWFFWSSFYYDFGDSEMFGVSTRTEHSFTSKKAAENWLIENNYLIK